MATILDLGILETFSVIFPILLVIVITFAVLQKTKFLGDSLSINVFISVIIGILVGTSKIAIGIIQFISPWFVLMLLFLFLLILLFRFGGVSESSIAQVFTTDKAVIWVIIVFGVVIILAGMANVLGQQLLEKQQGTPSTIEAGNTNINDTNVRNTDTGNFQTNLFRTIFHPKMLGLIFVMLVVVFTITLITRNFVP